MTVLCCGECLLYTCLFRVLCASWIWMPTPFRKLGEFSSVTLFGFTSAFCTVNSHTWPLEHIPDFLELSCSWGFSSYISLSISFSWFHPLSLKFIFLVCYWYGVWLSFDWPFMSLKIILFDCLSMFQSPWNFPSNLLCVMLMPDSVSQGFFIGLELARLTRSAGQQA